MPHHHHECKDHTESMRFFDLSEVGIKELVIKVTTSSRLDLAFAKTIVKINITRVTCYETVFYPSVSSPSTASFKSSTSSLPLPLHSLRTISSS